MKPTNNQKDVVVMVHGLGGSRVDMWPIGRALKRMGFDVCNWGYRSIGNRIETHAQRLAKDLADLEAKFTTERVHLVAHSMGGVIARAMFADHKFEKLGRVIMLAPPHQGSHMARKLTRYIGWLSPSLNQLSDSSDSYVNRLPNSFQRNGVEFAIVESSKDRVIVQGGVHLDGFSDYALVNGHHGVLTWYPETIRLVGDFLVHGKFDVAQPFDVKNVGFKRLPASTVEA